MKKISIVGIFIAVIWACNAPFKDENKQLDSQKELTSVSEKQEADSEVDSLFEEINQRIRKDINNPDLYLERSRLYETVGDDKAAVEDINRALRIDSTYLNTMLAQADFLLKRGKLQTSLSI